ncbi:MAG TPA: GGDEF domain-containing protein [Nannocystis sp.]
MIELDGLQAHVLVRCVERFREAVRRDLAEVVRAELRGFEPAEIRELDEELAVIVHQLAARPNAASRAPSDPWPACSVHEIHARMLKRCILVERRALAQEIDGPRQKTTHREAIRFLERELRVLDGLLLTEWCLAAKPARIPRLTDYVSIRHAEAARPHLVAEPPREYDDKFRILLAPSSFLPDLAAYRARCELRGIPIAVVYFDIDNFKAFNTRYGETRVDRDVLAPFMQLLEAHAFAHGHAYRMGGDEFVVLLPNADAGAAEGFVGRFVAALADLRCPGIDELPTVSAGIVCVGPDCFLTDREVQQRADRAKAFAKAQGKRCVAGYSGELMREEDLVLLGEGRAQAVEATEAGAE